MKPILLIVSIFYFFQSKANNTFNLPIDSVKTDSSIVKKQRKFKFELLYANDNPYKGRKDTLKTHIISPVFKYTGKAKIYFKAAAVNGSGTKKVFEEYDITGGKFFDFTGNWDGDLSYTHYFFGSKVSHLRSAISNNISANTGYDWDILYSQIQFDWSGGSNKFKSKGKSYQKNTNDYTFTLTNSHEFWLDNVFKKGADLILTPEVAILYGTQNFLANYKGKRDAANKVYQNQVSKFAITAYIITLDVTYDIKNFSLNLAPYYTIPENVPPGESGTPYFIMSANIYYTIKGK